MNKRIPQSFIDDLLARTDIVDLITQRIKLKKAGKNYHACCPFHTEKTPSFTVSAEKQFYHCFGCGAHGTAVRFLMEYENLTFPEAIEELASLYGMIVPYEKTGEQPQATDEVNLYDLMAQISRLYQHQLRQSPTAVSYLKARGLDGETAKRFAIGYTPAGWHFLNQHFPPVQYQSSLIELGMLIEKNKASYDRFRDRIMFPIRNRRGQVIAFGGRVLDNKTPKYLNSPETSLFHKGHELYGLYELKARHRHPSRIIVVEGYMDVVMLAQYGVDDAVASLGTATTPEQLKLMYRYTAQVICCYDGDLAGRQAAWRTLQNVLPLLTEGCGLSFCFLPDGQDPDSFVRDQGKVAFEEYLAQSPSFVDFMLERLMQEYQGLETMVLAAKMMAMIRKIPAGLNQEQAITQLARLLRWGEGESRLKRLLQLRDQAPTPTPKANTIKLTPVRRAIALIVQYPQQAATIPPVEELKALTGEGFALLNALLDQVHQTPDLNTARLLEAWRDHPHGAALAKLATLDLCAHHVALELRDILRGFFDDYLQQRIELLQTKSQHQPLTPEETQILLRYLKVLQN